ncbi:hypothetical protein [Curtobacterium sp. VKM Ac-2922]|uniref:hypothetical protein n=1 Tax=Curtobacterium sp. VKM Ac-2922 TaxID=2929475 RepID=UPI001FB372CB|nr:hypothetical protein [Curtobacterium sp. VKM Ac-2922]MCJ1712975.1 hypothetical protein [Curtobacterium sp. VKM Ac-2922]
MDRRPFLVAAAGSVALVVALTGCSLLRGGDDPIPKPSRAAGTSAPAPTADPTVQAVSLDPPTMPAGSVLTETDVTSPSGRTAIHVRVVVAENGTFRTELSGYRSTEAQAMTLEFRRSVPKPSDGYGTPYGQVQWAAGAQPPASSPLDDVGARPDFLQSVVLVPTVTTDANGDVDAPEWAGHVLAVAPLTWRVPNPYPHLTVTMGAARPGAYGVVNVTGSRGADYLVAHGDDQITVAKRFGITVPELRWMNPDMQVARNGWLTEYDHLNLDPSAR